MCSMQSKHGIVKFLLDDYSSMFKNCICSNAGKKNIRLRATDMQKKKILTMMILLIINVVIVMMMMISILIFNYMHRLLRNNMLFLHMK